MGIREPDLAKVSQAKLDPDRGAKGNRTRRRIMDTTAAMLEAHSFRDIRITHIARAAGVAQPNFYTYFSSIEDVVLALADEVSLDVLVPHIEPEWGGTAGLAHARQVVDLALEIWSAHRALFTVVNMLANERHADFTAVRIRQSRAVYKAFEIKVRQAQEQGRISSDLPARLLAYECVALLSSIGSHQPLMINSGFEPKGLADTTARLLYMVATGKNPAGSPPGTGATGHMEH